MGWLFVIVLIIIFIILYVKYPRSVAVIILSIIILCIVLWWIYIDIPNKDRLAMNKSITISISYNSNSCNIDNPLLVTIQNNSFKIVKKVNWTLNIYVPGHSTNVSGYDNKYSTDKILKPGEAWTSCYKLPSTLNVKDYDYRSLQYEISGKYVNFQE